MLRPPCAQDIVQGLQAAGIVIADKVDPEELLCCPLCEEDYHFAAEMKPPRCEACVHVKAGVCKACKAKVGGSGAFTMQVKRVAGRDAGLRMKSARLAGIDAARCLLLWGAPRPEIVYVKACVCKACKAQVREPALVHALHASWLGLGLLACKGAAFKPPCNHIEQQCL